MKILELSDINKALKKEKTSVFAHMLLWFMIILGLFGFMYVAPAIISAFFLSIEIVLLKKDIKIHKATGTMTCSISCLPVIKKDIAEGSEIGFETYYLYFSETAQLAVSAAEYNLAAIQDLYYVVYVDTDPSLCYSTRQYELGKTTRILLK